MKQANTGFEFDLSDNAVTSKSNIVINEEKATAQKEFKKVDKISDLTSEQKGIINRTLWNEREMSNTMIINYFVETLGLSEVIASNIVHIHRKRYLGNPEFYTIFDREKKKTTFTKQSMKFFNNQYNYV